MQRRHPEASKFPACGTFRVDISALLAANPRARALVLRQRKTYAMAVAASADSSEQLERLIGVWKDVAALTPAEIRPLFRQVVGHEDGSLLDALYAQADHDQRLIPWTPAWLGFIMREGELALIYDRFVFFQKKGRTSYKHLFCVRIDEAEFKEWHVPTLRYFTLAVGPKSYRISTYPRRGSHLKQVSGASESPGLSEVVGGAVGLMSDTVNVMGALGEALSMPRDYRIANAHLAIWKSLFERVGAGERAPFEAAPDVAREHTSVIDQSVALGPALPEVFAEPGTGSARLEEYAELFARLEMPDSDKLVSGLSGQSASLGVGLPRGRRASSRSTAATAATSTRGRSLPTASNAKATRRSGGRAAPGVTRNTVLKTLSGGRAMTASEIAAETGLARSSVSTVLSRLIQTGELSKVARGYQTTRQSPTKRTGRSDSRSGATDSRSRGKRSPSRSTAATAATSTRGRSLPTASNAKATRRSGGRAAPGVTRNTVLKTLSGGRAMTASEIAAETGLARSSVSTVLSRLIQTGELSKVARGYQTTRQSPTKRTGRSDSRSGATDSRSRGKRSPSRSTAATAATSTRGRSLPTASNAKATRRSGGRAAPGVTRNTVLKTLSGGRAMTASEIAAETGLARSSVSTVLSRLIQTGELSKVARGYQTTRQSPTKRTGRSDSRSGATDSRSRGKRSPSRSTAATAATSTRGRSLPTASNAKATRRSGGRAAPGVTRNTVLKTLSGGRAMTASEIAAETGLARSSVSTVVSRLIQTGELSKGARGYQTTRQRSDSSHPRPRSALAKDALELVRTRPGTTIPQIADAMNVDPSCLFDVLPELASEGRVRFDGPGWFPT